jgi:hypothetical protein
MEVSMSGAAARASQPAEDVSAVTLAVAESRGTRPPAA